MTPRENLRVGHCRSVVESFEQPAFPGKGGGGGGRTPNEHGCSKPYLAEVKIFLNIKAALGKKNENEIAVLSILKLFLSAGTNKT